MNMNLNTLKERAKSLKSDVYALYLACKDSRTPWYAKALCAIIIGYAMSPIDLIPDFIPVLGYLDDLILIPLGISFALKMIPANVMEECREKAKNEQHTKKANWIAGGIILCLWLFVLFLIVKAIFF